MYLTAITNAFDSARKINSEGLVNSRLMINWQQYFGDSKPVRPHFDGEYITMGESSPDLSEPITIVEALVPKYVLLVTVENLNVGDIQGTCLLSGTGETICPPSSSGDVLIFDNTRFFHFVPKLEQPRVIVGVRSFEASPFHYVANKSLALADHDYKPSCNGWLTPVTSDQAIEMLMKKNTIWHRKQKAEGLY